MSEYEIVWTRDQLTEIIAVLKQHKHETALVSTIAWKRKFTKEYLANTDHIVLLYCVESLLRISGYNPIFGGASLWGWRAPKRDGIISNEYIADNQSEAAYITLTDLQTNSIKYN